MGKLIEEIRQSIKPQISSNHSKLSEVKEAIDTFERAGIDVTALRLKLRQAERRQKQLESI